MKKDYLMSSSSQNLKLLNFNSFDLKYRSALDQLIETDSSLTFNNSGPSHASIVISNIYKHSKNIVRIYAKNMNGEISKVGNYLKELDVFLKSGKKLKIILDRIPDNPSPAFEKVMDSINTNVELKIASTEFKREIAYIYNPQSHFITGDDKMFRLEYDNYGHQALCGFNNKKMVKPLNRVFNEYFDLCYEVN